MPMWLPDVLMFAGTFTFAYWMGRSDGRRDCNPQIEDAYVRGVRDGRRWGKDAPTWGAPDT